MKLQARNSHLHLTDQELFDLALPPAGEPEALPAHLSECLTCSRALQQWKSAIRELGEEDAEMIRSRSAEEWEALGEKTLEAIRRARPRRRTLSLRWALAIAASLLLFVLVLPDRRASQPAAPRRQTQTAELSPQDQADDVLLRDVARLVRGEDGGNLWNALASEPGAEPPARKPESKL